MKIKARLTKVESDLLYDLIANTRGLEAVALYKVICRRLPRYIEVFGKQLHEPLPYSLLTKEDWVMLSDILNMSTKEQERLLIDNVSQRVSFYLWDKIGSPVNRYLNKRELIQSDEHNRPMQ